ncbi:MAG: hypothetical protein IH626_20860 [Rhodospirillales bacterium]|nr:hypothetical protein [Rhodospirillales bacterium]
MVEPAAPDLTPEQIEQLSAALAHWAERHPRPNMPVIGFAYSGLPLTPIQLAQAVRERSQEGWAFLRVVRFGMEVAPFEAILRSLASGEAGR